MPRRVGRRFGAGRASALRRTPPSARSRPRSRTAGSRRRSSSRSAGTTSGSSSAPAAFRSSMFAVRQLLEHVLVAGALGRIAGAALLRQHAERHAAWRAGCSNSDRSDFWKSASNAPAQPSQTSTSCFAGSKVSSAGRLDELLPLVVAEAPDVAAALEVVVHRAEILRRVAVRHQAAARADEDRQVLDADRALVLAGAAGRALPQHLLAVDLAELRARARRRAAPPASAG